MISARFLAAALMALTILAFPGIHAAESGDCAGVVLDENGVPVASARIQFESTIGRTYRTETDSSGRFILRNLLIGNYKVEVRKAGFFLLTGQSFTLHSGPNELTLTLNHEQELHEKIQVTAPSNQIDSQDTLQRSTLTARNIRDIPVPNSHVLVESLVALPEIVRDHRTIFMSPAGNSLVRHRGSHVVCGFDCVVLVPPKTAENIGHIGRDRCRYHVRGQYHRSLLY